jgi:ribonuclease D
MISSKMPPSKIEIALLPSFEGLEIEQIFVVKDERTAALALADLLAAGEIGFDTESKPTFLKGEKSEGPHVLQFSTLEKAYIFQSHITASHSAIIELLKSEKLIKVGFGLSGDLVQISQRFGIRPNSLFDLDRSFRQLGYRNPIGAKSAIAIYFNRKLQKSKSITTSNWSAHDLTEGQLIYAANDAYAALKVFTAQRESNGG